MLGVVTDDKLSWNRQNDINLLRIAKDFVGVDTLQTMYYKALVMPQFNHCSTVGQNTNQTHLDKLYKLKKQQGSH